MCLARMNGSRPGALGSTMEVSQMSGAGRPTSKGSTRNFLKPVPMGVGAPPWPQKLATLDWPPPPSPAGTRRPESGAGIGERTASASDKGLGATTPAREEMRAKPSARSAEVRNRAELWAVRSDIEQEKLRNVAPFPFFGRAMRFQDEFSALQITHDGRFSYSSVTLEGLDGSEPPCNEEPSRRRVITYEGILVAPADDEGPRESFFAEPAKDDGMAMIEGRAMARHEIEDAGGKTKLVAVERGAFRFSITVNPYFQPSAATVQPLLRPRSPGRPAPRKKQLPYVGTGTPNKRDVHMSSPGKAGDMRRLTQERRRAPKLKFSKSAAQLPVPISNLLSPLAGSITKELGDAESERGSKPGTAQRNQSGTASAPQLPSLPRGNPTKPVAKDGELPSVTDWRDFYRQRADRMLRATGQAGFQG
eukprot:gb/GFBE01009213.1/.p1 GENE.gb/GFBE01009213.1/~~gb/GFBE01009213.1/.p1  ORF type:complete len:420 (+),score=60.50 gb/GFBE01009213.1/:1-1260(+)